MATRPPPTRSRWAGVLSLVLAVVVGLALWWFEDGDGPTSAIDDSGASASAPATPGSPSGSSPEAERSGQPQEAAPSFDADSGLPTVDLRDLPPEAAETIEAIDRGPPYDFDQDGGTFGNYEGVLPDAERGYYQEFTVVTPGSDDRGARRIVEGADGELYWTDDHYATFSRILL